MSSTFYPPKIDLSGNVISPFETVSNYGGYGLTAIIFHGDWTNYDKTKHDLYTYSSGYMSTLVKSFECFHGIPCLPGGATYTTSPGGTYDFPNGWNETNFAISKIGKDPFTPLSITTVWDYQYKPEYAQGTTLYGNYRSEYIGFPYTSIHNMMEIEPSRGVPGIGPRFVLVSPDIVISESHFTGGAAVVGGSVTFLGNDGISRSYTITNYRILDSNDNDRGIYKLNTSVHSSITPILMMDSDSMSQYYQKSLQTKTPSFLRYRGKYLSFNSVFNFSTLTKYRTINFDYKKPLDEQLKNLHLFAFYVYGIASVEYFKVFRYLNDYKLLKHFVPEVLHEDIKYKNTHSDSRFFGTGIWSDPSFYIKNIQNKWRSILNIPQPISDINAKIQEMGGIPIQTPEELSIYNEIYKIKSVPKKYKNDSIVFYISPQNTKDPNSTNNFCFLRIQDTQYFRTTYINGDTNYFLPPIYAPTFKNADILIDTESLLNQLSLSNQPVLYLEKDTIYSSTFISNNTPNMIKWGNPYVEVLIADYDPAYRSLASLDPEALPLDAKFVYKNLIPNNPLFSTISSYQLYVSTHPSSISENYLFSSLLKKVHIEQESWPSVPFEEGLDEEDIKIISNWFELPVDIIKSKILKEYKLSGTTFTTPFGINGLTYNGGEIKTHGGNVKLLLNTKNLETNTKLYLHAATGDSILASLPIIIIDNKNTPNTLAKVNITLQESKNYSGISYYNTYDYWYNKLAIDNGYDFNTVDYYSGNKLIFPPEGGDGIYHDSIAGVTYAIINTYTNNNINEFIPPNKITATGDYEIKITYT